MSQKRLWVALSVSVLCTGSAIAGGGEGDESQLDSLRRDFPRVKVLGEGVDVSAVYGQPMTGGGTPAEAVTRWLERYSGVFQITNLDVRLVRKMDLSRGKATVFTYAQYMEGVRVEDGRLRVIVSGAKPSRVIYVSARLAHPPVGGFRPIRVDGRGALKSVKLLADYSSLAGRKRGRSWSLCPGKKN